MEGVNEKSQSKGKKGRPKKQKSFPPQRKVAADTDNSINTGVIDSRKSVAQKIKIIESNILSLECDAIVNAAKMDLLGGGGIDGAIHNAAGPNLRQKCEMIPVVAKDRSGNDIRCRIGDCVVTDTLQTQLENQYRYIFHTVGPDCRLEKKMTLNSTRLRSCYENVLQKVLEHNVKKIALCSISTGIYCFPKREAASIAFHTVSS